MARVSARNMMIPPWSMSLPQQQWQDLAKLNRKWYLAGYMFQDDVPNLDETIKAKPVRL